MRVQRVAVLIISLLMLVGFSTHFEIEVLQRDAFVYFKFGHVNNLVLGTRQVEVNTLLVASKTPNGWDYKHPLWEIGLDPGASLPVEKIKYGQVPTGFKEIRKASVLIEGQTYRVTATGPGSSGFADFIVSKNLPR